LLQSFIRIQRVDPGFHSQNALTFRVPLSSKRYPEQSQRVAFINQLEERIRNVPGVTGAGATSALPFIGYNSSGIFSIDGGEAPPGGLAHADIRRVTPGFFDAIGIPIQKGRLFNGGDNANTRFVALVDEKLAAQYWPGEDPIGKGVRPGGPQGPLYTIVGVVGHAKHSQLDAESKGALYFLYSQNRAFMITFVVRSNAPEQLAGIIQREAWAIDKDVPIFEVKTMSERLLDTLTPRRAAAYLVTVFAGLALVLAITGVYGVMSNWMALGAQARDVMNMVIRQGVVLALVGVAIGLAGSFALTRLMASLLFEVSTTDLPTFAGVSVLLIAVAIFACWIPARRASRVDSMTALRCE
jgi:predicted permease